MTNTNNIHYTTNTLSTDTPLHELIDSTPHGSLIAAIIATVVQAAVFSTIYAENAHLEGLSELWCRLGYVPREFRVFIAAPINTTATAVGECDSLVISNIIEDYERELTHSTWCKSATEFTRGSLAAVRRVAVIFSEKTS